MQDSRGESTKKKEEVKKIQECNVGRDNQKRPKENKKNDMNDRQERETNAIGHQWGKIQTRR